MSACLIVIRCGARVAVIDFWVVVHDQRFDTEYEIASHCDYWDFIGALVGHKGTWAAWGRTARGVLPATGNNGRQEHRSC